MDIVFIIGRVLYGGYFFKSGINHLMNRKAMAQYAASKNVPFPEAAVFVSGILALLGGLWVMIDRFTHIGLWEIIIFLIPVTLYMHNFWAEQDPMTKMHQRVQFEKNLALIGAAVIMMSLWGFSGILY